MVNLVRRGGAKGLYPRRGNAKPWLPERGKPEAIMQLRILFSSMFVATAMAVSAAGAGSIECCAGPPWPTVAYGQLPVPFVMPPTGFALDPSDGFPPYYLVNLGGAAFRTLDYARPAYPEGGHGYSDAYPYIASRGVGLFYHYRAQKRPHRAYVSARPYGLPLYATYRYPVASSARIIRLDD